MQASDDFYCERIGLVKLEAWRRGRVVLVGDAAYCPSVLTGMGTTCGLVGAYVLAGELSRLSGGGGPGGGGVGGDSTHATLSDALAAYEARFRPFMDQVQHGVGEDSMMARFMMPSSAIGIAVLHICLRVVTFLGIRLSSSSFMKEGVRDWELPRYSALVEKK
ncbi:FAD binding domain protein [Cordyceps javanica]|nr:FAD binding domain protein [Cordyceps javanica]